MKKVFFALALAALLFSGCHKATNPRHVREGLEGNDAGIAGFFLLNAGEDGSNKCTLDYYDYASGIYRKNIYAECNPGEVQELGDVGNELALYGKRLWAVVSASGLVEVMDAQTVRHIGSVSIPDCRYIAFRGGYAYVSSYAPLADPDPNPNPDADPNPNPDWQPGHVARVDTATLQVTGTCRVGCQPEEMVIVGNKLYVANSGIRRAPDYEHTVSVIDLESFEETGKIDVGINLHRMKLDAYGIIWVSSRGDGYDVYPSTYLIDTRTDQVVECMDFLICTDMTLCGDSLYVYCNYWDNIYQSSEIGYSLVNVKTRQILTRRFITDGTDAQFQSPNGIAVNPLTREFYVTDARDRITPGKLYAYTPEGRLKWQSNTGDVPSRIVFTPYRPR